MTPLVFGGPFITTAKPMFKCWMVACVPGEQPDYPSNGAGRHSPQDQGDSRRALDPVSPSPLASWFWRVAWIRSINSGIRAILRNGKGESVCVVRGDPAGSLGRGILVGGGFVVVPLKICAFSAGRYW